MKKQKTEFELLEGKLRLPIHISYIANYILKKSEEETKEVLNRGIDEGLFEESKHPGYYQLKNNNL